MNTENNNIIKVQYRLTGTVQGVGFRHFLKIEADGRGVSGWARNAVDGSLQVLLKGDEGKVGEILELMRQGPVAANVVSVTELVADDETTAAGFNIGRFKSEM